MTTKDTRAVGARAKILAYLSRNGLSTLDDITAAIGEAHTRAHSNLTAAKAAGLIESKRDDITNRPGYQITTAGKEWLKENGRGAKKGPMAAAVEEVLAPLEAALAAKKAGDSEGGEADITSRVIAAINEAKPGEVSQDVVRAAKRLETAQERDELHRQLSSIAVIAASYLPDPSDISTAGAVEIIDMLIDAQLAALADGEKARADLATRLDDVTQQHIKDLGLLTEKNEKLHSEIDHLRADLANKEREIERLKAEGTPIAAELVAKAPHGFILRAPKQPELSGPTYTQHEHAVNAAASAVRKGARRVRLFALLPAGQVVQGAEFID